MKYVYGKNNQNISTTDPSPYIANQSRTSPQEKLKRQANVVLKNVIDSILPAWLEEKLKKGEEFAMEEESLMR